jgi:acyl-CoA thioester hydrolase
VGWRGLGCLRIIASAMTGRGGHPTMIATPIVQRTRVEPGWLDYNRHMNEAFYLLVVSRASDLLLDLAGLDAAYRAATGCSVYTVETHLGYHREVHEADRLRAEVRLLGFDAKRLHIWSELFREDDPAPAFSAEMLCLHVDTGGPASRPFPTAIAARLGQIAEAHRRLGWPERAGRAIRAPSGASA